MTLLGKRTIFSPPFIISMPVPVTVYCLSGLGLSPAIFQRLTIDAAAVHHLEWLDPLPKESLVAYAQRMAAGITPIPERLVLIGHSFGGVLIQEISKLIPVERLILISSIKAKCEKDIGMNVFMRLVPINRLVTQKIITKSFKGWGPKHGYTTPEAQEIFLEAAAQHSNYYYRWATSRISEWEAQDITTPITHIHGTKDKTFPFKRLLHPVLAVEGGTHFMVFNKAALISQLINHSLRQLHDPRYD